MTVAELMVELIQCNPEARVDLSTAGPGRNPSTCCTPLNAVLLPQLSHGRGPARDYKIITLHGKVE